MEQPRRLSKNELKAIVDAEIDQAMGELSGELSEERTKSMDRYLGEPMGNELEGRSSVQSRDVMDTIEWILPSLIKMFVNSESSVSIDPVGPEDEEQAQQETDYINHIFWKKQKPSGFVIIYSWFKDALMQKNGVVKSWIEENEKNEREEYSNLLDIEYQSLMADEKLELKEHTQQKGYIEGIGEVIVHDAVFHRVETKNEIKVDVIAPEEFLISTDATSPSPKMARFTGHYTEKTISDLRDMGFTNEEINMMEDGITHSEWSEEAQTRRNLSDEERFDDTLEANEAMQTKKITECYIFADANGDGHAELLQVFRSGDFIQWEEYDRNPFASITPIILTHKFYGLSVADLLIDLQEIRTALLRSYLDNFNQTINGTTYYNEETVNIDDMLTSTPFGIRAVEGSPHDSVLHVPPSALPSQAFDMFDLVDRLRADRIGDFQSQLDPQVLANANNGVVVEMLNEAKGKIEMIARIFAETGVKELFQDIHELARKNSDEEEIIKLRNQWVPVNPGSWRERTDFTVNVGLGNRDRQQEAATISQIIENQFRMMEMGALAPVHIDPQSGQPIAFPLWESHKRLAEIMGEKNVEKFFPNPLTIPPPPEDNSQDNALALMAQVEAAKNETKQVEVSLKNQIEQSKLALQAEQVKAKAAEAAAKQDTAELKLQLEHLKALRAQEVAELKTMLDAQKQNSAESQAEISAAIEAVKERNSQELEKYKADLQASTTIVTSENAPEAVKVAASDQVMAALLEGMNAIQAKLNAPKDIMYNDDGMIVGIGEQSVVYDDNGNPLRIE